MSYLIEHTPYDLGLGIDLGDGRGADARGICFTQMCENRIVLTWEVYGCPKPLLIIQFDDVLVLRQLDETWLSTETNSNRWHGIDGSFARLVNGGEFPTDRSLMNDIVGQTLHFQFVTMNDCVDVISRDKPRALLADWSEQAQFAMRLMPG